MNLSENKRQWESLFRKWIKRLVREPGWDIQIVADRSISAELRGETSTLPANRTATIRYQPELVPNNRTGCHEVVHIVLAGWGVAADCAAEELPQVGARMYRARLEAAKELTVEMLTVAFLAAYGEKPQ